MPSAPLPARIQDQLDALAADVRRALALRGLGWLVLALFGGAAVAIVLDALLNLSGVVRTGLFLAWLAACVGIGWRLVVRPLTRVMPLSELASVVEEQFPGLSERLTTLVELSEHIEPANGSRSLIGVLGRETTKRTERLDFSPAAPVGRAIGVGTIAAVAAVVLLTPLAFVNGSTERVRRFVLPWYSPPEPVTFRLVVSSGDPVIKRGEPVTLTAYLERVHPNALLPVQAVLVSRPVGSKDEKKLPMSGDDAAAFSLTRPAVAEEFEYRIETGAVRSDWHTVRVVDPVTLADGSMIRVRPPTYAEKLLAAQARDGFAEFDGIQHGTASVTLKFTRSPAEATLEWTAANAPADESPRLLPLSLATDRLSATVDVPLKSDGTLRLTLVGDRGLKTEYPAAVRVAVDTPPAFERVVGLTADVRDVRPDERIPIDVSVTDDLQLAKLELEYCMNGDESTRKTEPLALPGVGTRRADGSLFVPLLGKATEGQTLFVRIRATDNRAIPDLALAPQTTTYPANGWSQFRVTNTAKPLFEQEITAQRDRIHDKLAEATKLVVAAANETVGVQNQTAVLPNLPLDQAVKVRDAHEKAATAQRLLNDLAGEMELTPDLRGLTGDLRDVAARPLASAQSALKTAETDPAKATRDQSLETAVKNLQDAADRLAKLSARNQQVASERLAQKKLAQLADDQKALADEAAKPESATDELAKKQRELANRLHETINENDLLKKGNAGAAAKEAQALAERLKQLADEAAALTRATDQTDELARLQRTQELGKLQRELADRAAELARKTENTARIAGTVPVPAKPFDDAQSKLTQGKPADAAVDQEKAARELDRLADALERAAKDRGETQAAARQIAKWQDDLRRRFTDATQSTPADKLPPDARQRFADEQKAIRQALDHLQTNDPSADQVAAQKNAEAATQDAAKSLSDTPANAADSLKKASDAVTKLANQIPSKETRLRQARTKLELLRREQDAINREANDTLRKTNPARDDLAKQLEDVAKKQDELAKKLRQLDTPGHEPRKDTTASAARRAADDLRAGLPQDIPASQQEAKRQLDRLRDALEGLTPQDEQAAELTRMQQKLADATDKLPPNPMTEDLRLLGEQQREINRRLGAMKGTEADAAKQKADAAETALRKKEPVDELRKKSKEAAQAMTDLQRRLAGEESDQLRAERLNRERAEKAEEARRSAQKPPNPEEAAQAKRDIQRQRDELAQLRAGKAQQQKKEADEALERLQQTAEPNRRPEQQQAAANALDRLAKEMARNGDRAAPSAQAGPPRPTPSDDLRQLGEAGAMPLERDADTARQMARAQRSLRDAAAQANEDIARSLKPAAQDTLAPLAKEQQELAKAIKSFAEKSHPDNSAAGKESAAKAEAAANDAAAQLRAGASGPAMKAATDAERRLREFAQQAADKPTIAKGATALAEKQAELNDRLAKATGDPSAELARQRERRDELRQEAGRIADAMRAAEAAQNGTESGKQLGQAASDAEMGRDKLEQAARESANGRKDAAATAQRDAEQMLSKAAKGAESSASGSPMPSGDDRARNAGDSLRDAANQMRDAAGQLNQPSGKPGASSSMQGAAKSLSQASKNLSQPGSQPGNQPGGQTPGQNEGGGARPVSDKDLPADVAKYLGKPWGDLPGDVKSRIIQEIAAKYGDDYARTIKLYFEQIASRK